MVSAAPGSGSRKDRGLRLIALFKFAKTVLLMAVGLGVLQLLDPDTAARAQRWATVLATSSDRRFVQHLLAQAVGLSPGRLEVLALGAFLYAGLFMTEGLGLWLGLRWAEYLTVVATASFVPIEIFEILQRLNLLRVGALVLNLAVVAYLIYLLRPRMSRSWPSSHLRDRLLASDINGGAPRGQRHRSHSSCDQGQDQRNPERKSRRRLGSPSSGPHQGSHGVA